MGDHVRNGAAAEGMRPPNGAIDDGGSTVRGTRSASVSVSRSRLRSRLLRSRRSWVRVGDGDGDERRFLISVATIASFAANRSECGLTGSFALVYWMPIMHLGFGSLGTFEMITARELN